MQLSLQPDYEYHWLTHVLRIMIAFPNFNVLHLSRMIGSLLLPISTGVASRSSSTNIWLAYLNTIKLGHVGCGRSTLYDIQEEIISEID